MPASLRTSPTELASKRSEAQVAPRSSLGRVLIDLSQALDGLGVPHAFQRGHRELPDLAPAEGVALVIAPRHLTVFTAELERVCRSRGARVRERVRIGDLWQHHLHVRDEDGRHHLLDFDVYARATCRGVTFFPTRELLGGPRGSPRPARIRSGRGGLG